jgi:hypothetical protein
MASNLKWHGDVFVRALKAELRRRIESACYAVFLHAKALINTEGAGKPSGRVRNKAGKLVKRRKMRYGENPSAPGEPPHKQMGRLEGSVAYETGEQLGVPLGRVGTNVPYGRTLEQGASGTRSSAWGRPTRSYRWTLLARPWLRKALREKTAQIKAIMTRPWNP